MLGLETKLQNAVANLNTALSSDPLTAFSVSSVSGSPGPVLVAHVQIGDLVTGWNLVGGGAFRFRVCMPLNSMGFAAQRRTQSASLGAGVTTTIHSDIYVYAHGDLWRNESKDIEARQVTLVMATLEDWIRTTFNASANKQLFIPSYEYGNNPAQNGGQDSLSDCVITTGEFGYYPTLSGDNQYLHAMHLMHQGVSPT